MRMMEAAKAKNNQCLSTNADDDYIDLEVSSFSSSKFLCYSLNSPPPQTREFEFQMVPLSPDRGTITSPADELFYKGKLLPLHLPPRIQMVQTLLHNPTIIEEEEEEEANFDTRPNFLPYTTNTSAPLESCFISPSESSRVSYELNPDDYCFEWSTELNSFIRDHHQKKYSWTKKLKQCSLCQKIKASRAYLKSLFNKSGCTDESCAKAASNAEAETASKGKISTLGHYTKISKKNPIGKTGNTQRSSKTPTCSSTLLKSIEREMAEDVNFCSQRRSFSGAIQWHSITKSTSSNSSSVSSSGSSSSSSSFSFSSNGGFQDLLLFKRSSSISSDIETSIEGAIAYCKQSQLLYASRKTGSEVGGCSFSATETAARRDQEMPKLCTI